MSTMKNGLKMIVVFLLAALFIFRVPEMNVQAKDFSDAVEIPVNSKVDGNLLYYGDSNYYKFILSEDGYITLNFTNPLLIVTNAYEGWAIYLYNDKYESVYSCNVYGYDTTTTLSPEIGLAAGTYYVKVGSNHGYPEDIYSLLVNYTASDTWEKESNNTFLTSTPISTGIAYSGSVTGGYDTECDYYKFTTEQDGCITLNFTKPLLGSASSYGEIELYNEKYELVNATTIFGNKGEIKSVTGLAAGTYYIKIISGDRYDAEFTNTYTICADFMSSDAWEKESNNSTATANVIELDKEYSGVTDTYDDYDYYMFNISTKGVYALELSTPLMSSSETYWKLNLYDSTQKWLSSFDVKGNPTSHKVNQALSAGTYYIGIGNYKDNNGIYKGDRGEGWLAPYKLKVGKGKMISSISASKTKTSYVIGDSLETADIKVTAKYSDGTTEDVTSEAEIDTSSVDMVRAGNYRISVTYGECNASVTIKVARQSANEANNNNGSQAAQQPANEANNGSQAAQQPANEANNGSQAAWQPANEANNNNGSQAARQPSDEANNEIEEEKEGNSDTGIEEAEEEEYEEEETNSGSSNSTKKIKRLSVSKGNNGRKIMISTDKYVTVKLTSTKRIFKGGKKSCTLKMNNKTKLTVNLVKKVNAGDKIKITLSRPGYTTVKKVIAL